jgi:hypothetical protein
MIGRFVVALTALLFLCLCWHIGARAAPPIGARPEFADWFRSLTQPGTGASCCDLSDCRGVRSRIGPEGYEVFISSPGFPVEVDHWVKVPTDKILRGKDNPLGQAVVCWTPHKGVICFVEGAGT